METKMLPGIGIFGSDPIVKIIVPYLQLKGFQVKALWALTLQDAESTAKDLKIPFHTNRVDDVLLRKDVELVIILCPPNLHSQIAVKALGIGKHVLCDRPAGLSQCEALKMVHAAAYYPSLICINSFGLRFHPAFIQMKRNIDKYVGIPKLAECRIEMGPILDDKFNWLCDDIMGGGNVTLFGSHLIDLITYLTGQRALRIHALTKTLTENTRTINGTRRITSPDYSVILMEMDSDLLVSMTLTNHMQKGYFRQEVFLSGSKGYLKVDENGTIKGGLINNTKEVVLLENEEFDKEVHNCSNELFLNNNNTNHISSPLLPKIYLAGLLKLLESLHDAFINIPKEWKKESKVGLLGGLFEEGLYVQAVIEAIKKSSKENQWVKLNIISEEPDPNPILTQAVRNTSNNSTISM